MSLIKHEVTMVTTRSSLTHQPSNNNNIEQLREMLSRVTSEKVSENE